MSAISSRARPGAVAAAAEGYPDPAARTTPTPHREEEGFDPRSGERAKEFALNLRTTARRMKQFLHGGK